MMWKVFQALAMATATLRNLRKGDFPHQIRPASQQAWHRAPSRVPHLRPPRGLKPSSPLPTAGKGSGVRLGIRGDIVEGNLPSSEPSPRSCGPDFSRGRMRPAAGTGPCPELPVIAPARAGIWLMGLRIKLSLQSKVLTGQKSGVILRSAG